MKHNHMHKKNEFNQVSLKEVEINLLSPIMISFRLISCFHRLLSRDPKGLFVYISDVRTKKFNGPYNSAKKACDQDSRTSKKAGQIVPRKNYKNCRKN